MSVELPSELATMLERRSVKHFADPGPNDAQIDLILAAATTVPDHNELHPWRFVVITGDERAHFGAALEAAGVEVSPELDDARREKLRNKAFVAPTLIVVVFSPKAHKTAEWEQEASASAAAYAMTLAAHFLDVGAIWKSAALRTGTQLAQLLGMNESERLMGWVNLGTPVGAVRDRRKPVAVGDVAARLTAGELAPWNM